MAEETVGAGSGPEGNGAGVDPTAVALALFGASRDKADAFLDNQNALIVDQRHHLHEQLKQIHLDVWEKQLGVLLRVATAVVGIAVAAFLGQMAWDAYRYQGLIIEAFSVPPDLAARGLTGEVVASRMLDKISDMQAHVNTVRAQHTYTSNWRNDIKVDIPETGISLDELERYLRERLGHPTHISGDVIRTPTGISVTARVGSDAGKTFSGTEGDFDTLLQQVAETVYASTQPFRYGIWLGQNRRVPESIAFFQSILGNGSQSEQSWAYTGWYVALNQYGRASEAAEAARTAVQLNDNFAFGWNHVGSIQQELGHYEAALQGYRKAQQLLDQHIADDVEPYVVPRFHQEHAVAIDQLLGDYTAAIREMQSGRSLIGIGKQGTTRVNIAVFAEIMVDDHDPTGARHLIAGTVLAPLGLARLEMDYSLENEDWPRVAQSVTIIDAEIEKRVAINQVGNFYLPTFAWPLSAYARAMMGDFSAAHAEIDKTPGDCDLCIRVRGRIDAAEKNYVGAAFWFAKLESMEPSIPFADEEWGRMLLNRGLPDAAIEKFKLSAARGPHFADPLEGWGEALIAKKQPGDAGAKFAEAEKYAPNWGRLHLKWGEALVYAGKKDEAQKQFARASQLDLTPSEKAELARSHAVATNP